MTVNYMNLNQTDTLSQTNRLKYILDSYMLDINTILLCKIVEINDDGSYDVQSIINLIDNGNQPVTPPITFNLPLLQIRGGIAAISVEPIVGDVVIVGFCQRDISVVKTTLNQQNPGSFRKFSINDGIILGILSNTPPSIYVKVTADGITIDANNKPINVNTTNDATVTANNATVTATNNASIEATNIDLQASAEATITAPTITLDGAITATSTIEALGLTVGTTILTASGSTIDGKPFLTHAHSGVTTGTDVTGGVE